MTNLKSITIPADKCDEFREFAVTALGLTLHPSAGDLINATPLQQRALEAYSEASYLGEVTLAPEDVRFIVGLKRYIDHFSKPTQLPLFGEDLHEKIVAAKKFLEQIF